MSTLKILGTGVNYPERRVTNDDLAKTIDTNDAWIVERSGIHARRIADPKKDETPSALGTRAATIALGEAKTTPEEIDLILVATGTPDYLMPNTACMIREKLGAIKAGALDIAAACSGFLYGLSIADAMIRSGVQKKILLIGAENLSTIVDWTDRTTCILFGDGAGAFVLGAAGPEDKSKVYSSHLYADGSLAELLYIPGGGSAKPISQEVLNQNENLVKMKGKEIFKSAVRMLSDAALDALNKNNVSAPEVDWFVPHQANLRIIEAVAKRMGIPMEKVITNLDEYGNTSAATIPTAFDQGVRQGKIKRGDLVLLDVFGGGATYGSALLRY